MQNYFPLRTGRWASLLLSGMLSLPTIAAGQPGVAPDSGTGRSLRLGAAQAEVCNTRGAGMNLRSGAGTGFPARASLPDGTVVDVVGAMKNSFWPIRAGGITGWGHADFLRAHRDSAAAGRPPTPVAQVPVSSGNPAAASAAAASSPSVVSELGSAAAASSPSVVPELGSAGAGSPSMVPERVAAPADPYAAALAQAKSATSQGEIAAASQVLSALLPRYPQDVDLPLQLGWLLFRATRYSDALYSYKQAMSRSAPGSEAELGVAWTLQRMGRCGDARAHFQAVLLRAGAESTAAEGLRLCTPGAAATTTALAASATPVPGGAATPAVGPAAAPRLWLQPFLAQSFFIYQNHPTVSYVAAPMARIEALLHGRYYGAVAYRYSYFATRDGLTTPWSQHDLYLDAGLTSKAGGATLHYALIADGSGYSGTTHHIGLSARYSHGFDSLLNLTASVYSDAPVLRGELAFLLPIGGGFGIRPGGALQWTKAELFKTLSLTLSYTHRYFSLWLGGKVGDEKRPAYLDLSYVYNSPARIPYGAWAGATVRPGAKFALTLSYSYDRLLRNDITPVQDSQVNALTLGLAREF